MKVEALNQIVRLNFFTRNIQAAISTTSRGDDVPITRGSRIYHNAFYKNDGPAWRVEFYTNSTALDDNIFKNNLLYKSRQNPQNTNYDSEIKFYLTVDGGDPVETNKIISNSMVMDVAGDEIINIYPDGRKSLSWAEANYASNFSDNINSVPSFVIADPQTINELALNPGSDLINAGTSLTLANGSGSSSTSMAVNDAGYFCDGFGIITGDTIQIANGDTSVLTDVNYTTNVLTLDTALTWADNEPINLPYSGSVPDIGLVQSGVADPGSAPVLVAPTEALITQTTAVVGFTTNSDLGTGYYFVSTSATAPNEVDLKVGTGSVDFGSDATLSVGANAFATSGFSEGTTYYTYFIQNDGTDDSNILESGSWQTTSATPEPNNDIIRLVNPDNNGKIRLFAPTGAAQDESVAVNTPRVLRSPLRSPLRNALRSPLSD
jgi:hypothetical protein